VQDIIEAEAPTARGPVALSYPEGTVGSLMDFDRHPRRRACSGARYLRRYDELPATDALLRWTAMGARGALPSRSCW
jgi:hypothetical protein